MIRTIFNLGQAVVFTVVVAVVLFCCSTAMAFSFMDLKEVNLEYRDFFQGGHDPLITQNGLDNRTLGKEAQFHLNIDFLEVFYFNNMVHGGTDEIIGSGGKGQFRVVGWNYELGFRLNDYINLFYHHHSQHLLDTEYVHGHWPVQDAWGLRIFIYKSKEKSQTLF